MKLTPARLFGRQPLARAPSQLKLSADGRYGSFLLPADDDRERLELWLVEMASGQLRRLLAGETAAAPETAEVRAERERRRQFAQGVTAYEWHPARHEILLPAAGGVRLLDVETGGQRVLAPPDGGQSGVRLSAKGNFVSFVRGGDLYAQPVAGGEVRRLSTDGGGTVTNGLADFIAQEEMHRFDGHWWSADEDQVAFVRVDATPVPETHRQEIDADGIRVAPQRYPFAGGPNVEVRLGIVAVATGEVSWLDWALAPDDYLARVAFAPSGALFVQAQSRDQRRLALRSFAIGFWQEVLTETAASWINLHDDLTFLPDRRFLWTSERGGTATLYVGRRSREDGSWHLEHCPTGLGRVNRILAATKDAAWVLGWQDDPTCQGLYRVDLNGDGQLTPVLAGPYWCEGVASAKAGVALATRASAAGGVELLGLQLATSKAKPVPPRPIALPPLPPGVRDLGGEHSMGRIETATARLHYRLTTPSPCVANHRHPVVVFVYGGPGVQRVRQEPPPLTLQLFAQAGFGVFELDNRGSANRDRAFEAALAGRLGQVEVEDQLAGVAFLRRQPWVDAGRIGIFGHSYGGYLALMCLAQSHVFAAGAAVAPVTDWRLYDTHYTERYLGMPAANAAGYAASAVLPRVEAIDAPLLLMHGMADDNVLFTHSLKLIDALQEAGKPFELMTYPGAKHALQQRSVAIHRHDCILDFFRRRLSA